MPCNAYRICPSNTHVVWPRRWKSRRCTGSKFLNNADYLSPEHFQGGYNLDSISKSALAVTKVLLGHAPDELPPMIASDTATETVWQTAIEQSKYWKNIDPKACEPREGVCSIAT